MGPGGTEPSHPSSSLFSFGAVAKLKRCVCGETPSSAASFLPSLHQGSRHWHNSQRCELAWLIWPHRVHQGSLRLVTPRFLLWIPWKQSMLGGGEVGVGGELCFLNRGYLPIPPGFSCRRHPRDAFDVTEKVPLVLTSRPLGLCMWISVGRVLQTPHVSQGTIP